MERRSRARFVLKWAFAAACALLLVVPAAQNAYVFWRLGLHWRSGSGSAAQQANELYAMFTGGILGVSQYVPAWGYYMASAMFGGLALYLWYRDRRRIPLGHCQKCAYNLTGNVSGVCPECGQNVRNGAHPS